MMNNDKINKGLQERFINYNKNIKSEMFFDIEMELSNRNIIFENSNEYKRNKKINTDIVDKNIKILKRPKETFLKSDNYYIKRTIEDQKSNYLVFSGIGNHDTFKKTLKNNNLNIKNFLKFPDHYNYTYNDIKKIKLKAQKLNTKILTTEKDYLRLNKLNSENIEYLQVKLKIKNEKKLINFLQKKL